MKTFKTIPADLSASFSLTDNQLALVSAITGKPVGIGEAPLVGKYVVIDGKRKGEREPCHQDLEFSYEWATDGDEAGKIVRIYVGSKIHGPMISWDCTAGWRNLYGHGNHGKNGSRGGTWSSASKLVYKTISEVLDNRDYICTGLTMHRSRLTEGPAIIEALRDLQELDK